MHRLLFIVIAFFLVPGMVTVNGQSIDSLRRIADAGRRDTSTITALAKLVAHYRGKDDTKSVYYMREVMSQPDVYPVRTARVYVSYALMKSDQGQYDSADHFFRKAEEVVNVYKNDRTLQSIYHNGLGLLHKKKGNNEEALRHYRIVDELGEAGLGPENVAGNLLNMANLYNRMADRSKAIQYLFKALPIFERIGNEKGISYCYNSLGLALKQQGQYHEAKEYLMKSLAIKEKQNDKKGIVNTCNELAGVFMNMADYAEAKKYSNRMLHLAQQEGWHELHATALINQGKILRLQGRFTEAKRMFDEAKPLAEKLPNQFMLSSLQSEIGKLHSEQKDNAAAIAHLLAGIEQARQSRNVEAELQAWHFLSDAYYKNHQYKEAHDAFQQYHALADTIRGQKLKLQYKDLETKYDVDKKNSEIALLRKDKLILAREEEKRRVIQTGVAIALVGVIAICLLLVNRYRIITRTKRMIELERVRNAIARDLHDDIGSTISSIHILSNVALKQNAEHYAATQHFKRIADQSQWIMERMSDIVWSISPENDSLQVVSAKMKEFTSEILDPQNIPYTFTGTDDAHTVLPIEVKRNIFLTYKEILNNAAKYSSAPLVKIDFKLHDSTLNLDVSDNGCGFETNSIKMGNGLRNIAERSKAMNASCTIDSAPGAGTTIRIRIPIT